MMQIKMNVTAEDAKTAVDIYRHNHRLQMETYARNVANNIGDEIQEDALRGKTSIAWNIQGDLRNSEFRTLVIAILKSNGYDVQVNGKIMTIYW